MWNSVAFVLLTAMLIVMLTLAKIIWTEHKRKKVPWGSPALWAFAMSGLVVLVTLWGAFIFQWLRI